jgi:hypothetical protein
VDDDNSEEGWSIVTCRWDLICPLAFIVAVPKLVGLGYMSCLSHWKRSKPSSALCPTWITLLLRCALRQGSDGEILGGGVRRQLQYCDYRRYFWRSESIFLLCFLATHVWCQLQNAASHISGIFSPKARLRMAVYSLSLIADSDCIWFPRENRIARVAEKILIECAACDGLIPMSVCIQRTQLAGSIPVWGIGRCDKRSTLPAVASDFSPEDHGSSLKNKHEQERTNRDWLMPSVDSVTCLFRWLLF